MQKPKKYFTWLGIIVVLLGVLAGSIVLRNKFGTINDTSDITNSVEQTKFTPEQPSHKYSYDFVSNFDEGDEWTKENRDGKIIRTDLETKEKVTVVPSVRAEFQKIGVSESDSFGEIARSEKKPYIYLTKRFIEGASGLVRYDWSTNTFKKLNSYYDGFSSSIPLSGAYVIGIKNSIRDETNNVLHLIDLDTDTSEVLAKLPAGQTFNICRIEGCLGDAGITVNWLDKDTFTIEIYNSTPGPINPKTGGVQAIVLETRKFNINK